MPVRFKAYEQRAAIPENFRIITQGINLREQQDVADLLVAVKAERMQGGVVILDTLNRAAPGMDENSSVDMGHAIEACKLIQQEISGLVLLVHHTGKDATKGLRGHSSLFAALDAAIEVKRYGDDREWSVAKAKDGEDGKAHPFTLEVVDMGEDEEGDPITSCVIQPAAGSGARVKPLNPTQRVAMDAFQAAAALSGNHWCGVEAWRVEFYRRSTADNQAAKQKAFARVRRELVNLGELTVEDDIYHRPDPFEGLPRGTT